MRHSPYQQFSRADWGHLRADTPLTLTEEQLAGLRGQNENVAMAEVADIYLPLTRLLNLYVAAAQKLYRATADFLASPVAKVPYIIGIGGSVAVGKSTTARILQALLARWAAHPRVALVATDGFLFSNRELKARGLARRKGFPESYDLAALVHFVSEVKGGRPEVKIPVYSHHAYDILPGQSETVRQPDIMIVEGLNVLQAGGEQRGDRPPVFLSDYFDFTIYVDAPTPVVKQWYVERFLAFCEKARGDPSSFFHLFADLALPEARARAERIWTETNELNLHENILPTRERSRLILEKGADHSVQCVRLRKL